MSNLKREGFEDKPVSVVQVGDVMQDSALFFAERAEVPRGVTISEEFIVATLHRAENTDNPERLGSIIKALNDIHGTIAPVVLPLHPRTRNVVKKLGLDLSVQVIDPVGYFEMVWLLSKSGLVLTDSGGVQKEAFFFGKACVTMRDQTEWVELINAGVNELVGADYSSIIDSVKRHYGRVVKDENELYGGGRAASRIANYLSGQ